MRKTAVAAPAPDPMVVLRELLWARLRQLAEPDPHWLKAHGYVNLRLAVWDQKRGWLMTRPGLSHDPIPLASKPLEQLERDLMMFLRTGVRALKYRWDT